MGNTIEIIQGSTPTLELTIPASIDLTNADIYFSASQFQRTVLEKKNTDGGPISVDGNIITVNLSQMDTLQLQEGEAKAMVNIVYNNGAIRIPTYEAPFTVISNQIKRILV